MIVIIFIPLLIQGNINIVRVLLIQAVTKWLTHYDSVMFY